MPRFCEGVEYTAEQKAMAEQLLSHRSAARVSARVWARQQAAAFAGAPRSAAADPVVDELFVQLMQIVAALDAQELRNLHLIMDDPPDPAWRTLARPPRTFPARLLRLRGAPRRDAAALLALERGTLGATAADACVSDAINRGSTALSHGDAATARRQYGAGAACARTQAALAATDAGRLRAAGGALRRLDAVLRRPALRRRVARGLRAGPAARRSGARRATTALRRLIALPAAELTALRDELAAKPGKVVPGRLPGMLRALSADDAAFAALARSSAASLLAASR